MGRLGITYEQVAQAAEKILLEGQNPTIHRIRASLGDTGSITTINKYLNQWKSDKLISHSIQQTAKLTPSNPVTQAADQVWQQLMDKAQEKTEEEIEAARADYQLQIEKLIAENKHLKMDFQESQHQLEILKTQHASLNKEHQKCLAQLQTEKQQRAVAQECLAQNEKLQIELKQQSKQHLESLKNANKNTISHLKDQLTETKRVHTEILKQTQTKFNEERQQLFGKIHSAQTQIQALQKELQQQEIATQKSEAAQRELHKQLERLLTELEANKTAFQKQSKQLLESEKLVSQFETKLLSSETQVKNLSQELKKTREKYTKEISRTSHLTAQLRQLEKV